MEIRKLLKRGILSTGLLAGSAPAVQAQSTGNRFLDTASHTAEGALGKVLDTYEHDKAAPNAFETFNHALQTAVTDQGNFMALDIVSDPVRRTTAKCAEGEEFAAAGTDGKSYIGHRKSQPDGTAVIDLRPVGGGAAVKHLTAKDADTACHGEAILMERALHAGGERAK